MSVDIEVTLNAVDPLDLAEAIGRRIAGDSRWKRDGILEQQVSTREDVQLCFRNEPAGDRPRTALCLAGTDETLTVATVVPIDRGIELDDEQYAAVVREFCDDVLEPASAEIEIDVTLQQETA